MKEVYGSPTLPDHPAFIPPPNRHPVAAFFGMLFALIVLAGASFAVYVWEHQKVVDLNANVRTLQSQAAALQQQILAAEVQKTDSSVSKPLATPAGLLLNNGAVALSLPNGWVKATAAGLNSVCTSSATARAVCEDVATVVPSTFNNDSSSFSLDVKVFQNTGNATAKDWFINDYGGSLPLAGQGDQTSTASINGYSAYYFLQNAMPTYQDVYYVIAAHGQSVALYARVYQLARDNAGAGPGQDFRQYLPAIQAFANSIKLEGQT